VRTIARVAKANATTTTKSTSTARKAGKPAGTPPKIDVSTKAASVSAKRPVAVPEAPERRKPGRPKTTVAAVLPKTAKATKAAARVPAVPPAPKVSKDELRAQAEKLEQLVADFRTKGRQANKAAKAAAARISEWSCRLRSWTSWHQPRRRSKDRNRRGPSAGAGKLTRVMLSRRVWLFRSPHLSTRRQRPPFRSAGSFRWAAVSIVGHRLCRSSHDRNGTSPGPYVFGPGES
jgi:hypothetical protein